jgi:ribosomal protein S12 methylthiotransferase accessory factor
MEAFADQLAREAPPQRERFLASIKPLFNTPVRNRNWPFADTAPKAAGFGLHRIIKPEATFERLRPFFTRIGITRIADVTGLDRVGIPVYSAIIPRSRDVISVYNGKGFTAIDAKTGAVMEATERYVASRDRLPDEVASYRELSTRATAIDPRSVNLALHPNYNDNTPVAWLKGIDLLSEDEVFVPHGLACFYGLKYPWQSCYSVTTSNGLASGNSIEEAACHALAEVIERDAHSIMDVIIRQIQVVANRSPWLRQSRVEKLIQAGDERYPLIELDSLPERAAFLVQRFRAAGLEPTLRYAGSECGTCTVLCLVREDVAGKFSRSHYGAGTDPDPAVAVVRALTEAAQSRAVDMQAVREDLSAITQKVDRHGMHTSRSGDADVEHLRSDINKVSLSSINGHVTGDILDDIQIMLDGLRATGIKRCVMVDLSAPEIPAKVVRIIAPGLESWIADHGKVGGRAKEHWRQFAACVQ